MTSKISGLFWRSALAFLLIALSISPKQVSSAHAQSGTVTRVSVDTNEAQANAISYRGDISADGRFIAFDSEATNLSAIDVNNSGDVFLRDLTLGTTSLISLTSTGVQPNGGSGNPSISGDGHFVAFESDSTNLTVTMDTNGFVDIYIKDTQTGAVARASLTSANGEPNADSTWPSISGDGRYVVFASEANNLVLNDTNGVGDIFVRDMQTGTTLGVSILGNAGGFDGSISLDGRFVVFNSLSTNLVPDDTNGVMDVFVYSVQTGQVVRASVNSSGVQGDHYSIEPSISGDGRYVTFSTSSNNFTTLDTYGYSHLYVRDMQTGTTTLASFINGYVMVGESDASEISANGRYIVFSFDDKGDGMPDRWLYIHDREANITKMVVNRTSDYSGSAALPTISADGRMITFVSSANSFVADDTNGVRDVFVKDVSYPQDLNPTVISVQNGCPNGCSNASDQFVDFLVKFSEPVTGVDVTDFALTIGGGIVGATVATVSGVGSDYVIHVDTGTGDGTLRLDVLDDDSIKDFPLNPLGGVGAGNGGFASGDLYKVDKNIVAVTSIMRLDSSPTMSGSVRYAVNFSEPVTGVDLSDFIVVPTGSIASAMVTEVLGGGTSYTVTVNTGTGDGMLRLDLVDDDSILDAYSNPLGWLGVSTTGIFPSGEVYTVDRTAPTVVNILRLEPDPTAAATVHFSVIFSEPVKYVDVSQFALTANGPTGIFISELSIDASTAIVTVNTGTGNGTIQLSFVDNDTLFDAVGNPIGGTGIGNGSYIGPFYSISKKINEVKTEKLRSNGKNDGWILETNENSNLGGTKNSVADTFRVGDDGQDRQYRSILHFPTSYLPDNAVITQAILTIKAQGITGIVPFTTHGNMLVDICYGSYGYLGPFKIKALQSMDFQSPANLSSAAIIQNNAVGGWYWAVLTPDAFPFINKTGNTQLRLAFHLDDNDDLGVDFISFFSGDATGQADRPHLLIDYYVP